jgi:hypothetical protein
VDHTWDDNGNLLFDGMRSYTYDHANRLTQITGTLTTQYAYNGDGARTCGEPSRTISKTVDGATSDYVLDLAASLPVVISDTEAIYLYGLDIIAARKKGLPIRLPLNPTAARVSEPAGGIIPSGAKTSSETASLDTQCSTTAQL